MIISDRLPAVWEAHSPSTAQHSFTAHARGTPRFTWMVSEHVVASYARVRGKPTLEDLGYPQQVEIYRAYGGPVVDAADVLRDPPLPAASAFDGAAVSARTNRPGHAAGAVLRCVRQSRGRRALDRRDRL